MLGDATEIIIYFSVHAMEMIIQSRASCQLQGIVIEDMIFLLGKSRDMLLKSVSTLNSLLGNAAEIII